MIGQRSAVMGGTAAPVRTRRAGAFSERAGPRPAVAGRQQLREFLRQSVLMQLMLAMALVSFAALIYLNQASKVSVLQFNIAALQSERIQLNIQNASLYATGTSLQSLPRIENLATTRLHMTRPDISNIVWITTSIPRVTAPSPDNSATKARLTSQPLSWMEQTIQFIGSQF